MVSPRFPTSAVSGCRVGSYVRSYKVFDGFVALCCALRSKGNLNKRVLTPGIYIGTGSFSSRVAYVKKVVPLHLRPRRTNKVCLIERVV